MHAVWSCSLADAISVTRVQRIAKAGLVHGHRSLGCIQHFQLIQSPLKPGVKEHRPLAGHVQNADDHDAVACSIGPI